MGFLSWKRWYWYGIRGKYSRTNVILTSRIRGLKRGCLAPTIQKCCCDYCCWWIQCFRAFNYWRRLGWLINDFYLVLSFLGQPLITRWFLHVLSRLSSSIKSSLHNGHLTNPSWKFLQTLFLRWSYRKSVAIDILHFGHS